MRVLIVFSIFNIVIIEIYTRQIQYSAVVSAFATLFAYQAACISSLKQKIEEDEEPAKLPKNIA